MPRDSFVTPETVRLPLSDDRWIEVKERLSNWDRQKLQSAAIDSKISPGGDTELRLDMANYNIERLIIYLTDWNLEQAGESVELSRDAVKNLDPDLADEIVAALDKHVADQEERKKAKNGKVVSVPS